MLRGLYENDCHSRAHVPAAGARAPCSEPHRTAPRRTTWPHHKRSIHQLTPHHARRGPGQTAASLSRDPPESPRRPCSCSSLVRQCAPIVMQWGRPRQRDPGPGQPAGLDPLTLADVVLHAENHFRMPADPRDASMGAGCSITAAVTAAATAATSATEAMWIHQQACALVRDDLSGTATWLRGELSWWRPSAPWTNQPANGPVRAVTPWVWMDMEIQLQVQRVTSYPIARQAFVSRFVKGRNDNLKANKSTETPHQSCLAAPSIAAFRHGLEPCCFCVPAPHDCLCRSWPPCR